MICITYLWLSSMEENFDSGEGFQGLQKSTHSSVSTAQIKMP